MSSTEPRFRLAKGSPAVLFPECPPLERQPLPAGAEPSCPTGGETCSFFYTFPSLCPQRPQGRRHPAQSPAKGPPGSEGPKNQGVGVWPHCQESGVKESYSVKCQRRKGLPELLEPKRTMDGLQKFPLARIKNFKLKDGCQHRQSGDFAF